MQPPPHAVRHPRAERLVTTRTYRPAVSTPSPIDSVSSSSAVTPVPRPRSQSASFMPGPRLPPQPPATRSRYDGAHLRGRRPRTEVGRRPVHAEQPGRESLPGQQRGRAAALHDGCRGPRVGLDAGAGGDGDTGPHRLDRQAGGRVEDVVQLPALAAPLPGPGARGRQSGPRGQADHGGGVVGLVPHEDPPAADRPGAGRGDVAAERDQHADPQLAGHHPGAPVGGPGLRGGTEVQRDVGRHRDDPALRVDVDALPPRRGSADDAEAVTCAAGRPGSRGRSPARRARRRGWGRPPRR